MIIIDSSVWIDYFNGTEIPETNKLDQLLGVEAIAIGDLILTEVLQGFRSDTEYKTAK
ncbi:PIN domain nuclease [Anabaena sp. UHCC 0253]|uniref:PIN domain nuclease n=1 Tax=Anabaena sp. UHCC 0253 TaxID=2590019 RepID=UPI0014470E53|nr:PIN domain nuclease [Anabaena sp. UHCC 0253]MTJ55174.1 PIN domain nuclease [Anabaena sp. UHCC 0253]